MPVDVVTKMWSRDDGQIASSDGRTFTLSQTDSYQITCTPDTSKSEIAFHPSVPKVGASLIGAPFITVKDVKIQRETPTYWTATVKSSGELGSEDPSSTPIDNTPTIKVATIESEAEVSEDRDGKPIVTVNDEPIFGVKKKIYDLSISITRNFLAVNDVVASDYLDAVNSDTFLGFEPGRVKLTSYSYDIVFSGDIVYYKVTGNFVARKPYNTTAERAWFYRTRHEGFYEKVGSEIIRAVDDNQEAVTKPVLLKEDGTRETDSQNAHFLEFEVYDKLPYNALGFI